MKLALAMSMLAACGAPAETPDAGSGGGDGSVDAAVSTSACVGRAAQPLDATWTIDVGGVTRTARVHVPASYDPAVPAPLVLNIHGRTSNATQQQDLSHAIAKSDSAGFIVIHPQSATSPTSWNAGGCCDPATTNAVDDLGFLTALLDEAEAQLCVDPDRVYSMGLSNGGFMSYRLACEVADRVAAIGPVAGTLLTSPCSPSRPVPLIHVHGTADYLAQYTYTQQSIAIWRDKNQCTTMQTTYQQGNATCVRHGGCTAGADVVLCTIQGGGHQWPGGETLPFLGMKSDDLIATDAIWEFFSTHPRP